jgi:hypothetical protein
MKGWFESPRYIKSHSSLAASMVGCISKRKVWYSDECAFRWERIHSVKGAILTPSCKRLHLHECHAFITRRKPDNGSLVEVDVSGNFVHRGLRNRKAKDTTAVRDESHYHKSFGSSKYWTCYLRTCHLQLPPPRFRLNVRLLTWSRPTGMRSFNWTPDWRRNKLYMWLKLLTRE